MDVCVQELVAQLQASAKGCKMLWSWEHSSGAMVPAWGSGSVPLPPITLPSACPGASPHAPGSCFRTRR